MVSSGTSALAALISRIASLGITCPAICLPIGKDIRRTKSVLIYCEVIWKDVLPRICADERGLENPTTKATKGHKGYAGINRHEARNERVQQERSSKPS